MSSDTALTSARQLPVSDGIFCGISGGAAVAAALEVATRPGNEHKLIVTIIPSFGERYLSSILFLGVKQEVGMWKTLLVEESQ